MKRWLIIAILVIASTAWADGTWNVTTTCDDCTGKLGCQNFEGTGYDNSETWTEGTEGTLTTGVLNEDYAVSPIRGSQSLRMKDDSTNGFWTTYMFPAQDDIYLFMQFKLVDYPAIDRPYEVMTFYHYVVDPYELDFLVVLEVDATAGTHYHFTFYTYGTGGGHLTSETTERTTGTVYNVWLYLKKGTTNNNAQGWLRVADANTFTMPGTNNLSFTNGTWGTDNFTAAGFTTQAGAGYEYVVDHVIFSSSSIGSVCP